MGVASSTYLVAVFGRSKIQSIGGNDLFYERGAYYSEVIVNGTAASSIRLDRSDWILEYHF